MAWDDKIGVVCVDIFCMELFRGGGCSLGVYSGSCLYNTKHTSSHRCPPKDFFLVTLD